MIKKYTFIVLVGIFAWPCCAQNKGKNLLKAVESAVSRQTATQALPRQISKYHPVFGYTEFQRNTHVAPFFNVPHFWYQIQVAPILELSSEHWPKNYDQSIRGDLHRPVHLAQAVYLWRLANPNQSLRKDHPLLFENAKYKKDAAMNSQELYGRLEDYPAVKLLTWLLDEKFQPHSYAQIVATLDSYPKYIVLNEEGFPERTERAEEAALLDSLLMLSDNKHMERWNNVGNLQHYYKSQVPLPFVLTDEEKQAATRLATLREQAYQLPQHPTTRQLIEQAYNELESQAFSYSNLPHESHTRYMIYPFYEQSALSVAISQKLEQLNALGLMPGDAEYGDYVHLLVLNTMMRGTVLQTVKLPGSSYTSYGYRIFGCEEVDRTIWAFRELCKMTPHTEANKTHLYHLQQGLRMSLGSWTYPDMPFLRIDFEKKYFPGEPAERIAELRYWAHRIFEEEDVRNLVGTNLK